jgi:hypothetical protein
MAKPQSPNRTADTRAQREAKEKLTDIKDRIMNIATDRMDSPLGQAGFEILNKMGRKVQDLEYSSKLYRAIDDIEIARATLADIADELRELTGWRRGD